MDHPKICEKILSKNVQKREGVDISKIGDVIRNTSFMNLKAIKKLMSEQQKQKRQNRRKGPMSDSLLVLENGDLANLVTADDTEKVMLSKAGNLIALEYPEHALLELWNASIHNLRRRVEMYSTDIFVSTISTFPGRKSYKKDGDSLAERWGDVDDKNLIDGATQIGVLNKKAGKALEMINWMRNHASPAHDNEDSVTKDDVIGLAVILKTNLFDTMLPDPAHSPVSLIEPIKNDILTEDQVELLCGEIKCFSNKDIRTVFGYAVDVITSGEQPEYDNIMQLFNTIWEKAPEELRTNMGLRVHNYMFDPSTDTSSDNSARDRLYDALLNVSGVKYIPDNARAAIYRGLARRLAIAKDSSYGWAQENLASMALAQVGAHIPSSAFEDVYQEILSVWCGNYWGRSNAHFILRDFIFGLTPRQQIIVAKLFMTNDRVRSELVQSRPKNCAIDLLNEIKDGLTNSSQISEIEIVIADVEKI